ncbi:MAG: DNA adenine methylase [Thermoplasmataceae archaeon]|jgi:DNA adenine methylase
MAIPILKWAGGKRQIIGELIERLPPDFHTYHEPFLGGGALFFKLCELRGAVRAVISDINPDLIMLYQIIRDQKDELVTYLHEMGLGNNRNDYYKAREIYNSATENPLMKSALLIYLNRHGFNGLYRLNSSGRYNVPFGRYTNPSLPSDLEISRASQCLSRSSIRQGDFRTTLSDAEVGDFAYLDPPYMPVSATARFTSYSSLGFTWKDQKDLAKVAEDLDRKGVKFMLSNAANDEIEELYSSYRVEKILARRNINSKPDGRGKIPELIVRNY